MFQRLIEDYEQAHDVPAIEVAAALAKLFRGDVPLLLKPEPKRPAYEERPERSERPARNERFERGDRAERPARAGEDVGERSFRERPVRAPKERIARAPDAGMETYRLEVGYDHGVKPGNIVGAVANEAQLEAKHIGRIEIFEDYSLIDLPQGMPDETLTHLKGVWCAGQQLRITRDGTPPDTSGKQPGARKPFAGKKEFGERKPFAGKKDFGDKRPFKPKPKPHRKGPGPE
jgi:ATP-dependent RNA helicase DeaD